MPVPAKLLVAFLVAALLAAAAFLIFGGEPQGPLEGVLTAASPHAAQPAALEAAVEAPAPPLPREAAALRNAVEGAAADAGELDPSERAALAGFTGRVLHHDGEPAARVRVALFQFQMASLLTGVGPDLLAEAHIDPGVDGGEATTGDDGRFHLGGVWPRGMYLLHAGLGSDNPTLRVVESTPGAGEVVDLGDIVLMDGAVVTGTVVDEAGKPVAGALVRVVDLPATLLQMAPVDRFDPGGALILRERDSQAVLAMPPWVGKRFDQLPLPRAATAADGTFRVTGIQPGVQSLWVTQRGYASTFRQGIALRAGETHDCGELELREGEEAFGAVQDQAGRPVAGAEVLVGQAGAAGVVYFAVPAGPTDARGEFSAPGFGPGKVVAAARRQAGDPWVISEPQSVASDIVVKLPALHRLTVRLQSAAGAAVADPEFRLLPGEMRDGAVDLSRFGFTSSVDLGSRLRRLEDGRYAVSDLSAGAYTLLVRCPGHALAAARIDLQGDVEQVVALQAAAKIAVRVLDPAGQPVRAAAVFIEPRGKGRVSEMPLPLGKTDAAGRVELDQLPAGTVLVSASHPAFGWVHAEAVVPGAEIALAFATPGALEGVLTEGGRPPELGKWVVIVNPDSDWSHRPAMMEMPRLATPNAEGAFSVSGLSPGKYQLQALESFQAFLSPGKLVELTRLQRFDEAGTAEVDVAPGQTAHVRLDAEAAPAAVNGPSARIHGTVFVDGRPGTGMVLRGWTDRMLVARVDESGRFDFGQVAAGRVHLSLESDSGDVFASTTPWQKTVEVTADKDVVLEIAFATGTVTGTVRGPDGMPIAGAQIRMQGPAGQHGDEHWRRARTVADANGSFRMAKLPAGRYSLRAEHEGDGAVGVRSNVEVQPGLVVTADVELRSTVTVAGTLDLSVFGTREPEWIWFGLESVEGAATGQGHQWTHVQDGQVRIENVVPGTHRVRAHVKFKGTEKGEAWEQEGDIVVGSQGVTGAVFRLRPQEPKR